MEWYYWVFKEERVFFFNKLFWRRDLGKVIYLLYGEFRMGVL